MTLDHRAHWDDAPLDDRYGDFESLTLSVEPDERVGAPPPRRSRLRRAVVGLTLVAGAGVAVGTIGLPGLVVAGRDVVAVIVSTAQEMAARSNAESPPGPMAGPGANGDAASMPAAAPVAQADATDALPLLTPVPDEKAAPAAAEAPATEALGTDYAETAAPAETAQDQTPKRKRAIAAGLGPDLPNVLLTRLSKADLENAGYAIKTALATTRDDAAFSWPKKPSRQQALFEVRFVEGAPAGCRRYIVTVTKDRWSSTSAALEKCGLVGARAG